VSQKQKNYDKEKDSNLYVRKLEKMNEKFFNENKKIYAGQSKRIWEELYKVIDSSDVLCMVLDARDPLGTKCFHAEEAIKQKS
jgi:nuclear GTP-binding protein